MKRARAARIGRHLWCVGLIALLCAEAPADSGLAQERSASSALELTLDVSQSAPSLGEPVYATVRLVNTGDKPVEVFKHLDPQTGALQIVVSSSSRPRKVFLPLFYADAIRTRTALVPGEAISAVFPIFYGALGWTFDQPGTYRVTAEYRLREGAQRDWIRSSTVSVTVGDEAGGGALLLAGTSASDEAAKFLLWQRGDHLQAGQALLTALLAQHPDSLLADYAGLAFGRNLSRSFRDYIAGKIRHADCEPALAYFRKVRSEQLPVYLQIQQHLDEARCLIRLSRPADARASMEQVEQLRAGRPEFNLVVQQAIRLEPALGQMISDRASPRRSP